MPDRFLRWQSGSRLALFDRLQSDGADSVSTHLAHLPVLATLGDGDFPISLACKGMGPIPRPERIVAETKRLESAHARFRRDPAKQSLSNRLEIARGFYADPANFDPFHLGGLEIFERRTLKNLCRHPLVSLLFMGEAPDYLSFQFNGVIELVEGDDPRRRFLLAARELFAGDSFHVSQSHYSYGCLFHPCEIIEKTPFSRS